MRTWSVTKSIFLFSLQIFLCTCFFVGCQKNKEWNARPRINKCGVLIDKYPVQTIQHSKKTVKTDYKRVFIMKFDNWVNVMEINPNLQTYYKYKINDRICFDITDRLDEQPEYIPFLIMFGGGGWIWTFIWVVYLLNVLHSAVVKKDWKSFKSAFYL